MPLSLALNLCEVGSKLTFLSSLAPQRKYDTLGSLLDAPVFSEGFFVSLCLFVCLFYFGGPEFQYLSASSSLAILSLALLQYLVPLEDKYLCLQIPLSSPILFSVSFSFTQNSVNFFFFFPFFFFSELPSRK